MGSDSSKMRVSQKESLPSIKLPSSASYHDGMYKTPESTEISRARTGSASSRSSQSRHPLPMKMRRLIQSCFSNPHEMVGRRIMKRACDLRIDFCSFYLSLETDTREELEECVKILLKKVVTNIDFVDEIQRLSEEFGVRFACLRSRGFKPDYFAVMADAMIKECTHLDSAVHKAHTTTHAFSQFGAMVFSSVRDGYYAEVRRLRRTSNSFSTGSNGSEKKKRSLESVDRSSVKCNSRGSSPRTSLTRCAVSPRSVSPESASDESFVVPEVVDDGFLKPPTMNMVTTRTY